LRKTHYLWIILIIISSAKATLTISLCGFPRLLSILVIIHGYFTATCNTSHIVYINESTFTSDRVSVLCLINLSIVVSNLTFITPSNIRRFIKLLLFFRTTLIIMISSSPWNIISIKLLWSCIKLIFICLICILITFISVIILLNLSCSFLISHFLFNFKFSLVIKCVANYSTWRLTTHLSPTSIVASVACWWDLIQSNHCLSSKWISSGWAISCIVSNIQFVTRLIWRTYQWL